jgi:hypothetical protein
VDDLRAMIDVVEKEVQRFNPLSQSRFKVIPLSVGENTRNEIEGDDLLSPLIAPIHEKRCSRTNKGALCLGVQAMKLVG